MKIYKTLATVISARLNCLERWDTHGEGYSKWIECHTEKIEELLECFPSGGGFDAGTQIDLDASTGERLVFTTAYHHMHDSGMYDGWTEHQVIVTPSLLHDFSITVKGRNKNGIKDFIGDCFHDVLAYDTTTTRG